MGGEGGGGSGMEGVRKGERTDDRYSWNKLEASVS